MTPAADSSPSSSTVTGVTGPRSDDPGWIMLIYRIPSEPSRLRAGVWRKLRSQGAIYLQNSVAVLPDLGPHERIMRGLRAEIVDMGGAAQVLRVAALAGGGDIVAAYNAARDEEYDELVDKCRDFLSEIDTETAAGHVTYGELEENEEDLTKLRRWLARLVDRDVLQAASAPAAQAAVTECEQSLEGFAHRVYGADPDAR